MEWKFLTYVKKFNAFEGIHFSVQNLSRSAHFRSEVIADTGHQSSFSANVSLARRQVGVHRASAQVANAGYVKFSSPAARRILKE